MSSVTSVHQLLNKRRWNLKEIEKFLKQDSSSINATDCFNLTPLKRVVGDRRCSVDMLRLLFRFGAHVNDRGGVHDPPLQAAIRNRRDESIIRVLLEAGADFKRRKKYQQSLLCIALHEGASKAVIQLLLNVVGVSKKTCGNHGSPMHCVMDLPLSSDVWKLIISAGADVNGTNLQGESPMCIFLRFSPKVCDIKELLRAGFCLGACKRHASPLFCATDMNLNKTLKEDVVQLLLEKGASTVAVDQFEHTPLQRALLYSQCKTGALKLLFHSLKVNVVDGQLATSLLSLAIQNPFQKPSAVRFLLKQGANVTNINLSGNTALHLAARSGNPSSIKILLEQGAEVNSINRYGKTPLRLAVESGGPMNAIQLLLAAGARVEDYRDDSLLKIVINRYEDRRLDGFKMLTKYSLLENPDLDICQLIQGDNDCQTLSRFVKDCKRELRKMESKYVCQGSSLRDFINGNFLREMDAILFDSVNFGYFNRLLKEVPENAFSTFLDVISSKFRRSSMKRKLDQLMLYTVKHCPNSSSVQQIVILNFYGVCEIAKHLSDGDLLRLIFAFYNAVDLAQLIENENENVIEKKGKVKRSRKQSAKCSKRPKPCR